MQTHHQNAPEGYRFIDQNPIAFLGVDVTSLLRGRPLELKIEFSRDRRSYKTYILPEHCTPPPEPDLANRCNFDTEGIELILAAILEKATLEEARFIRQEDGKYLGLITPINQP